MGGTKAHSPKFQEHELRITSGFFAPYEGYRLGVIIFARAREDFLQVAMPLSVVFLNANPKK
jgi:hypothetical protein